MIRGLHTVIYSVADATEAESRYSQVCLCSPYRAEPFYDDLGVGDFELGLLAEGCPRCGGANATCALTS